MSVLTYLVMVTLSILIGITIGLLIGYYLFRDKVKALAMAYSDGLAEANRYLNTIEIRMHEQKKELEDLKNELEIDC